VTDAAIKAYQLEFTVEALKEWAALDGSVKAQFKTALKKRLLHPHVASARLGADLAGHYKIKLRTLGFRLVYRVDDGKLVVVVGKRDKNAIYDAAAERT
jgi:mRNA interferase RelE/StbE